jgi:importin subunit alpha-1
MGVLPNMILLAQNYDYPQLQYESLWALTNIASGTSEQCEILIGLGILNILSETINSEHKILVEQSIWAIGNIGGDCVKNRDLILSTGVSQNLL